MPAVTEISEETEIEVELVEHREQSTLHSVQFKVARKARQKPKIPDAADVTLVMRTAKLGVREADLDALTAKYGALKVTEGLDAMEAYVSDRSAANIINRGGYLKAVLANRFPDGGAPGPLSAAEEQPVPKVDFGREQHELVEAWKANRQKQIRAEFSALPEEEKVKWIDLAAPTILQWSVTTPAMRKRVANRDWESPLISRVVLDVYASSRHGAGWKAPSEMDLVMFTAGADRQL